MCGKQRACRSGFLEVWHLKDLAADFSDLWQIKQLVAIDVVAGSSEGLRGGDA